MTYKQFITIIEKMDISEENKSIIKKHSHDMVNDVYNDGWYDALKGNNKTLNLIYQKGKKNHEQS